MERKSKRKPKWLSWLQQRHNTSKSLRLTTISEENRPKVLRQELASWIDPKLKSQLRWLELWDIDSIFSENVDLANSQAALAIPLVDLAVGPGLHIALSMSYTSGEASTNSVLGNGWTIHNVGQDLILLSHKQSAFAQNHEYQLFLEGRPWKLVPSKELNDKFTIENEPNINITYLRSQNRWIVDTPNMRTVYGTSEVPAVVSDALQWSLHWPHWRGPGTDEDTLLPEVVSWYMVSREETTGLRRKLYYSYLTKYRTTSNGKPFTSAILLESIFDQEMKSVINLIYDTKPRDEYVEKAYKDADGDIQFPVYLLQNHYLLGFHLETEEYQQQLLFGYEKGINGIRKLTSLCQVFNENGGDAGKMETIFNFEYQLHTPNQYLLAEIEVPAYKSSIYYTYQPLQIPLVKFKQESVNTHKIPTVENVQITQNHDTGVLAYDLGNGGIYLDVYNVHFTMLTSQLYTASHANNESRKIVGFTSLLFPNLIAVMEETAEEKRLHIFLKDAQTKLWSSRPNRTIALSNDALIRYSDTLIVVSKNEIGSYGRLLVIQPSTLEDLENEDKESVGQGFKEFELTLSNGNIYRIERLVVQGNVILAYNGYRLHGWRENPKLEGIWDEKVIHHVHSMEKEFLESFDVKSEHLSLLLEQINTYGLQMSDNMILLSTLEYKSTYPPNIITNANLILVDDQLEKVTLDVKQVKSENIYDLETIEEPSEGFEMTLKYQQANNKYQVALVDIKGSEFDKMCEKAKDKNECKKEVIKYYMEDDSFKDKIKGMMLFDYEPFISFQLDSTGVTTKETKFKMSGVNWESKEIDASSSIKIGSGFVLETDGRKSQTETIYSLYRQNPENGSKTGVMVGNWTMQNGKSGLAMGYPFYMAIQPDLMNQPELVTFREKGTEIEHIRLGEPGEQIVRMSNNQVLFTIINSTDPAFPSFDKRLVVRNVNTVIPSAPLIALAKTEVRYANDSRTRSYEVEFNLNENDVTQENIVRVIPADRRSYTGYYEEITVIPIQTTSNVTKTQNWYDSQGQLVVTKNVEKTQQKSDETEERKKKWHTIWDITGQLEISNISPYNASQQDVVYFGFEPYENNTVLFDYETSFVSSDKVSLTGTNVLRLTDGHKFIGFMSPTNQQGTYVASTWLRFPFEFAPKFEFDAPLENFKAFLTTQSGHSVMGVYAQMKRQQRDWIFAEIILDLDKIRNNVYSEIYQYSEAASNLIPPSSTYFTIKLKLDATKDNSTWMDIDHVRFAPIGLDWTVTVYDPRTGWVTEQILPGGGILRNIYNRFSTEISTVDEYGQIEQFKSLSRTGCLFPKPVSEIISGIQQFRHEIVIIPQQGYHERFDDYSLKNIWNIEDYDHDTTIWKISKGRLVHLTDFPHQLSLKLIGDLLDSSSSAVRFNVKFSSISSFLNVSLHGLQNFIQLQGNGTLNVLSGYEIFENLPSYGELLFHVTEEAMWIWFDGVLLFDQKFDQGCVSSSSNFPWNNLMILVQGHVEISDIIALSKPQLTVEYFNTWGERTQIVQLDSSDSVIVCETIYDKVGRDAIKTKATKLTRMDGKSPLIKYHTDFVINRRDSVASSVFKNGLAYGLANDLNPTDEGYPYFRSLYQDDMLRETKVEGLPGKEFSIVGTFTKKHSRQSGVPFIDLLFPTENGFLQKVTYEPNGNMRVAVLDTDKNEVAVHVKVVGYNSILTIYEYNSKQKLVKMLPPKYHDRMRTHLRTKPWTFGDQHLTSDEKYWQGVYGTHYTYDEEDQLVLKRAPDQKPRGFLYDAMGNVRFMYNLPDILDLNITSKMANNQVVNDVVYMLHVGNNKPVEIGYFKNPVDIAQLKAYQNGTTIPISGDPELHQKIVYSDTHSDPEMRGKVRLFLTYDASDMDSVKGSRNAGLAPPHQELLKFNSANHVTMKTSNALYTDTFTNYQKFYKGNKLEEISYPMGRFSKQISTKHSGFSLFHSHDKMGRLTGLGTRTNREAFARILYNPTGQVEKEIINFGLTLQSNRSYEYNSPGLLTRITDSFLTQDISFIEGGYGQQGHGDGIVMSSFMSAAWSQISRLSDAQKKWFTISEDEYANDKYFKMCLQALRRVGVLDEATNIPIMLLTKDKLSLLPISCSGETGFKLMKLVAKYLPPINNYGHSFNYGSYQELTKAKFLGNSDKLGNNKYNGPLRITSFFEEIPEITSLDEAEAIWDALARGQFLLIDGNAEEKLEAIGKPGIKGLFRHGQLTTDLQIVNSAYVGFAELIIKLLYQHVLEPKEMISLNDFQETIINWHGYNDTPTANLFINRAHLAAEKIYNMLHDKEYLSGDLEVLLSEEYLEAMKNHTKSLKSVTRCLTSHFDEQIGTNVFDFESFYNDPNGNRLMFYQGLVKYELEYQDSTNKVKRLKVTNPYGGGTSISQFEHDNNGNLCKAEHKGLQLVKYHPVTNRPMLIVLEDGRRILFKYDAQGERVLKRVFSSFEKGQLLSETKYLRDENGRVLMDKVTKFGENKDVVSELESTYIYGPRGNILGFYRNGKYYNVFTDHAGSTRLITHSGNVVAGYDYWPYGELLRTFGDEDCHLAYRFTGQEYDKETGLYNYHARLYDPAIGRFFQPDPKSQYFSPYVYGGNNPVSMVDPDGEFFGLIIGAVVAIVGAYMGGKAANGGISNPFRWNWSSPRTLTGMISGAFALTGMVSGVTALVASIGFEGAILVGLGGIFLQMANVNNRWNPNHWDWSQTLTYNTFVQGIRFGINLWKNLFSLNFSRLGQMLIGSSNERELLSSGNVASNRNLKLLECDILDPVINAAVQDGFMTRRGSPEPASRVYKAFADMSKNANWNAMLKEMQGSSKTFFKQISENPQHLLWNKLGKTVLSYIATGEDKGTLDLTKSDWHSTTTFEGFLNTFKIASDIKRMAETYRKRDWSPLHVDTVKEGLLNRLEEVLPILENIIDGVTLVSEFYGLPHIPSNIRQDEKRNIRDFAGTLNAFTGMAENSNVTETEEHENDSIRLGMVHILDGLRAGSEIYPVVAEEIAHLIDCKSNTAINDQEFAKCAIGSSDKFMARRNQEFSKTFFIPSQRYQSSISFLPVELTDEPREYLEQILTIFQNDNISNPDTGFYESLLVGTIFHSFLNTQAINNQKLYIKQGHFVELGVLVTHIGLLMEKEGKSLFNIRTIISLKSDEFRLIKDQLESHLKNISYECYLPSSISVDNIMAEAFVISTKDKGVDLHVITKDYQPSTCQTDTENFTEIPQPTGETVFQKFSSLVDDNSTNMEEKEQLFQQFFQALVDVTSQAIPYLPTISFLPFVYGLMYGNVRKTYVSIEIDRLSQNLLVVPRTNSKGQQTFQSLPLIFSTVQPKNYHTFLYKSAFLTLSNVALIGQYSQGTASTSKISIPKFVGILDSFGEEIDQNQIENVIRYIYFNKRVNVPNVGMSANTTNSHFVSNFILGEFLSRIETTPLEVFVLAPSNLNEQSRLQAQRLFFVRNPQNNSCTLLNVIESSKVSNDSSIPAHFEFDSNVQTNLSAIPDVKIEHLKMVQINLNSMSIDGWKAEKNLEVNPERYFWQDIHISVVDHQDLPRDNDAFLKLDFTHSTPDVTFSKESITAMFSTLVNDRFQILVNDDQDFQSVILGILLGASTQIEPNTDGVTMVLRQLITDMDKRITDVNMPTKLSLLSIAKGVVIPQTEQVLLASLKTIEDGENSDDVETKLNEARNELKMYQCSIHERLKETFKVTSVPAVFDSGETGQDPEGNRVFFEMGTEKLSEMSCNATENPFRQFLKTGSLNINPIEKDQGFFDSMKTKFGQYFFGNQISKDKQTKPVDTKIEKCHLGAWTDGQYSMDGITCTSGKSKIAVFQNIEPNDLVRSSSRGDPFHLVGDTYDNGECTPISFNGRESVACKGEKSTLIYTPYVEPRLFDELDGNLMLGRVAMHLGGKMWSFARTGRVSEATENHIVTEEMVDLWECNVRDIQAKIGKWDGDVKEMDWVKENLHECQEMLENIKENDFKAGPEIIEVVEERLAALKEDVTEQILYAKTDNMFGDKKKGDRNEGQNESRNAYYEGISSAHTSNSGLRSDYGNNLFGIGQVR